MLIFSASRRPLLDADNPILFSGAGITPRVIHRIEPEYSSEAKKAGIQGVVVTQLIVTGDGRPTRISTIRPIGYGLDEKARLAIEKWQFEPAQ